MAKTSTRAASVATVCSTKLAGMAAAASVANQKSRNIGIYIGHQCVVMVAHAKLVPPQKQKIDNQSQSDSFFCCWKRK